MDSPTDIRKNVSLQMECNLVPPYLTLNFTDELGNRRSQVLCPEETDSFMDTLRTISNLLIHPSTRTLDEFKAFMNEFLCTEENRRMNRNNQWSHFLHRIYAEFNGRGKPVMVAVSWNRIGSSSLTSEDIFLMEESKIQ